jgi:hypothetical protein
MAEDLVAAAFADDSRSRIKRLFEFLRALDERRNPIAMAIGDHRWALWLNDLPAHETVRFARGGIAEPGSDRVWFLRVARPRLTTAPKPPEILAHWLQPQWETWGGAAIHLEQRRFAASDGSQSNEYFQDDAQRQSQFEAYSSLHQEWQNTERPARVAYELFEKLYGVWGDLRREGEACELMLGNATLNVRTSMGDVYHPLILARVQLEFDSSVPEFRLVDAGHPPELYQPVFRRLANVSGTIQNDIRNSFEREPLHPAGEVDALLQWSRRTVQWLHSSGEALSQIPGSTQEVPHRRVPAPVHPVPRPRVRSRPRCHFARLGRSRRCAASIERDLPHRSRTLKRRRHTGQKLSRAF